MRVLLQRVSAASVVSEGKELGRIGRGFCLLVGFTHADSQAEVAKMTNKLAGLRLFSDDAGKMNLALADVGGAVLVVSQFTLYGDASAGRRPSFTAAARPDHAEALYESFCRSLAAQGLEVARGKFGAHMQLEIHNDGPVTLLLEMPPAQYDPA